MTDYNRKFCKNVSFIKLQLTCLLKKTKQVWVVFGLSRILWSNQIIAMFQNPAPRALDFTQNFSVAIDASGFGIGVILLQQDKNNSTGEKKLAFLLDLQIFYWFIYSFIHLFFIILRYFICPVGWGSRIHRLYICRGVIPHPHTHTNEYPGYDIKQSDGEVPGMLELWGMQSTPLLPSLPGPLWPGVIAPEKGPIYGLNRTKPCFIHKTDFLT